MLVHLLESPLALLNMSLLLEMFKQYLKLRIIERKSKRVVFLA